MSEPARITPLAAVRAFAVMLGGSVLLAAGGAVGSVTAIRAVVRGRVPSRSSGAVLLATGVYLLAVRPWMLGWGATPVERGKRLAGDEIAPRPGVGPTRAVSVDASPEEVWPWVAQLGQDRGGFYSYAWLENLAGCELENTATIHPEWQHREFGELIMLHPLNGLPVARFDPPEALVMKGWGAIVVEPDGAGSRLIARGHAPKGPLGLLYALLLEIPHFVMERKMLLGIKSRAEDRRRAGNG